MADVSKLQTGTQLRAKWTDGKFYAAKVAALPKASKGPKARQVKVEFQGYGEEAWVPVTDLRSKLLLGQSGSSSSAVDYTALSVGTELRVVDGDGFDYAAEVVALAAKGQRTKAPVKVCLAKWVGVDKLKSRLLTSGTEKASNSGVLTTTTAATFVNRRMAIVGDAPVDLDSKLVAEEVGGGNINFAFKVSDNRGGSVFVKQALPFIKVLGKDAKLDRERMKLEVDAFREFARILGPDAPDFIPRIYIFDRARMAFIMEYLGSCRLLQAALFEGRADSKVAAALGRMLGLIHARSHSSQVSKEESKRLTKAYENPVLRGIQLEYVFSKCYQQERAAHLRDDEGFMSEVEKLKALYRGERADNLSMLHGDLHAGSVMADEQAGRVKLIDPEFAIYGPPGLDVGSLISTYGMAVCYRAAAAEGDGMESLISDVETIWDCYSSTMTKCGIAADTLAQTAEDAIGFAGCEIARTALGFAYERSLKVDDPALKAKAEDAALSLGASLIRDRAGGISFFARLLRCFSV